MVGHWNASGPRERIALVFLKERAVRVARVTPAAARPWVLLLEGDPDIQGAMAEALQDEGYEVTLALDGHEGLRVLESLGGPCLVLVDLELPWVDGRSLLQRLGADARFEGVRVVGMTGEPGPLPPGVVQMLRKPVSLDSLLAAVTRHCPRRETPGSSGSDTQLG